MINPLLIILFARSLRQGIAFGFYSTDLPPSSFGLYEKITSYNTFPYSVNKSLIMYTSSPCKEYVGCLECIIKME